MTKTNLLHPERIINLGRLNSAPALAFTWRDLFALWCKMSIVHLSFVSI